MGEELKYMNSYDYAVINDDLDSAVEKVHSIINTEMNRISRMNLDKFLEDYIFLIQREVILWKVLLLDHL